MNQQEIRNQVENLIRMNRISNQLTSPPEFKILDLVPLFTPHFTQAGLDAIKNQRVQTTLVQWNRQVGNSKYEGEHAASLGKLLGKLKIKSYEDLFASNYVREVSQVKYYGQTVEPSKVADAALVMVNFINDLASKNLIRGILAPLTALELVGGKIVIVSYIAVDQPNEALVQSMYGNLEFKEGAVPPEYK